MDTSVKPARLPRPQQRKRRIPIAVIMALSIGMLVLVSVGGVLALAVGANLRNTVDLLGAQSALLIDAMEDSLSDQLGRAEDAVDGIVELYAQSSFEIDDTNAAYAAMAGALSAAPQVTAMLLCTPEDDCRGAARDSDEANPAGGIRMLPVEREKSPQMLEALEKRRQLDGRRWGAIVPNEYGLFANVSAPLSRDGSVQGWVIAAVELQNLSAITRELSARFGTHAFILDADGRVLADARLADPEARKNGLLPPMPVAALGDPVLAAFPARRPVEAFDATRTRNVEVSEIELAGDGEGLESWTGDPNYIVLTRQIPGYGGSPWTIGAYFANGEIGDELQRVAGSAIVGLIAMAVAVLIAILLGKRLSRPIRAIAGQATRVADFDIDSVTPLPRSRVLELDNQALAFNAMLIGLRAFSTYIPRSLVAKLVRTGEIGVAGPREAIVTVMFTDIAGFTTLSEQMDATTTARVLNHHFALLCGAVDAQGGTVDKFLGDGMMAFFGAPDRLKGHAAAAVRAAAAIRDALEDDNRLAVAEGRPLLRIRIGIHTGSAIVGNIGAADRVNYTIVGDTVNISQRLQDIGKLLAPDAATTIVVSGETASRLDERFETIPAGKHRLRGRGEATEVFVVGAVALTGGSTMEAGLARAG